MGKSLESNLFEAKTLFCKRLPHRQIFQKLNGQVLSKQADRASALLVLESKIARLRDPLGNIIGIIVDSSKKISAEAQSAMIMLLLAVSAALRIKCAVRSISVDLAAQIGDK